MPSCVYRGCRNYTGTVKDKSISFHTLPKDGPIREKWLNVIRTQRREYDWLPSHYSTVCTNHFLATDVYVTEKQYRRIKKTAVPVYKATFQDFRTLPTSLKQDQVSKEGLIRKPSLDESKVQLKNSKLCRNIKKCNNLKQLMTELQNHFSFTSDQFNELSLKADAVDVMNRLMQKSKFKGYRHKYTPPLRKFAVTLHYYSADAYKYVRQSYSKYLPHPRVIGKWYENNSGEPGFNKQALDLLDTKYKNSGNRILCTLIADEMALRHQTMWTEKTTAGLVDFGAGSSLSCENATRAYVFILVCMNESWKIPVAYFLVNELSAETRANLLKICLSECYRVGVDIVAITFNGCASNINAANLLGCDLTQPSCLKTTFKHPDCGLDIAIMLDPCHMIKLVRNTFESKRLIFDWNSRVIRWQLLENLMKLQKNMRLNFANKITPRHIHFRNEVMKMKLATQIMNQSVANALRMCDHLLKSSLFVDTAGTIEFIEIFNILFNVLNSKTSDLYGMKKPLSHKNANEVINFLENAKEYILGLHVYLKYKREIHKKNTVKIIKRKIVETKNKTGFLGFLICIESLKHLYSTLVKKHRLRYIATHRLSQNHIEILFNVIKRHVGYNNLNVIQFKDIFKKVLQHLNIKSSFLGSYVLLEDISVLTHSSAVYNMNSTLCRRSIDDEINSIHGYCDQIYQNSLENNRINANVEVFSTMLNEESVKKNIKLVIGYISGWVSWKLASVLKCSTCIDSLFCNNKLWFHKLITLKHMVGLCFPSEDVFKICLKSEAIIKNHIKEKGHMILPDPKDIEILRTLILNSFISVNDVFACVHQHSLVHHPTFDHRVQLIRAIIHKFVNVRLQSVQKISLPNYKTQKVNKLCLFQQDI